jgi:hypothetical protein
LASAKRPQNAHDLFAAAAQAAEEVDISVSQEDDAEQKKTGARNESSVLFSLDALKAGIVTSPQPSAAKPAGGRKGPPVAPKKKLEDIMSGGTGGSPLISGNVAGPLMMSSNQALLTAPAPPPPKPEPKPVVLASVPAGPAVGASASLPEPPKKKKGLVVVVGAIAAVAVIAGIAIAVTRSGSGDKTVASASASPVESVAKPTPSPEPVKTAEPPPAETKPAEAVASASAAPSASSAPVAVAAGPGHAAPKTNVGSGPKPGDTVKEPKKAEPSGPVSSGVASFNRDAAIQALSVAASQASSCKKPDGPTGSGKVQVTFAPSGRATTAVVVGGAFGGTPVGGCVSSVFKRARVPPFSGDPVTVSKGFSIIP